MWHWPYFWAGVAVGLLVGNAAVQLYFHFKRHKWPDIPGWMPPRGGGYRPGINTMPPLERKDIPPPPPSGGAGIGRAP